MPYMHPQNIVYSPSPRHAVNPESPFYPPVDVTSFDSRIPNEQHHNYYNQLRQNNLSVSTSVISNDITDAQKPNSIFERSKVGQSYSKDLPTHPETDSEMLESIRVFEEPLKLKKPEFHVNPESISRNMEPDHPMLEGQYYKGHYPATERAQNYHDTPRSNRDVHQYHQRAKYDKLRR